MANLSLSSFSSFESLSSSLPPPPPPPSSSSSYSNNYNYGARIRNRKPSLRSMAGSGSRPTQSPAADPISFCDSMKPGYFLDSCYLCGTLLHVGDDIYMYRGDAPFCSEECRQEQIDIDEAEEGNTRTMKMTKKNSKAKISSKSHEIHVRAAETVVAW